MEPGRDAEHRACGIGRELTDRLLAQVRVIAGGEAFLGLFATEAAVPLYRRDGFDDQTQLRGMWQIVRTP